jgi:hypothetical protein
MRNFHDNLMLQRIIKLDRETALKESRPAEIHVPAHWHARKAA